MIMLRDQGRSLAGDCFSSRREAETKNKTLVGREPKGRDDPRQADSETRITMKSVISAAIRLPICHEKEKVEALGKA